MCSHQPESPDSAWRPPTPERRAVTAALWSSDVPGRSSGLRLWRAAAGRSGTGNADPTHPSRTRLPECHCRSSPQLRHNAGEEPYARSEVKEGARTKLFTFHQSIKIRPNYFYKPFLHNDRSFTISLQVVFYFCLLNFFSFFFSKCIVITSTAIQMDIQAMGETK